MSKMTPLIQPHLLSHGTIECEDMKATRAFLEEFLGLDVHRPLPEAQYMWKGGPWTVVCVRVDGGSKEQTRDNHFEVGVGSAADVDAAHAKALAQQIHYGIRHVDQIVEESTGPSFLLLDLNNVWWKISTIDQSYFDALFERGDVAA